MSILWGVRNELQELLAGELVIARRDHPSLWHAMDHSVATRDLVPVLEGIYARAEHSTALATRALAVCLADPDAVILGEGAAAFLGWSLPRPSSLVVATRRLRPRAWLRVSQRRIDPEVRYGMGRLTLTSPAMTALDLSVPTLGASIDEALRRGVPLAQLEALLLQRGGRRGVAGQRLLIQESRDEPWSAAERRAHVLLRKARISGWRGNVPVRDARGTRIAVIDIAFRAVKLAIEIDGDEWHLSPGAVLRDRQRDQDLAAAGWTVVRFRAAAVFADPDAFVADVRRILVAHGWRPASG